MKGYRRSDFSFEVMARTLGLVTQQCPVARFSSSCRSRRVLPSMLDVRGSVLNAAEDDNRRNNRKSAACRTVVTALPSVCENSTPKVTSFNEVRLVPISCLVCAFAVH